MFEQSFKGFEQMEDPIKLPVPQKISLQSLIQSTIKAYLFCLKFQLSY